MLGGSAMLAGSWVIVAVTHGVPGWEQDFFEWVNDLPDALWPVVWGPMQLGSLAGSLVVVVVTLRRDQATAADARHARRESVRRGGRRS